MLQEEERVSAVRPEVRVLVIEDSPSDAALITDALDEAQMADGRVMSHELVTSLGAARQRLSTAAFDCVLLDLRLPDADGLLAVERLLGLWPDLALIVLTGLDRQMGLEAVERGAQDYLLKSETDSSRLRQAVMFAVQRAHLRRRSWALAAGADLGVLLDQLGDRVARARTEAMGTMPSALAEIAQMVTRCRQTLDRQRQAGQPAGTSDLGAVVERALLLLGSEVADRKVTVEVDELPHLSGPPDQVLDVMMHLLRAAIRGTVEPGRVWVTATQDDGWTEVEVGHDGPVTEVDSATARSLWTLEGRGPLGSAANLEFCRAILIGLGGSLWVTTNADGEWVTRFRLPMPAG